MQVKLRRVFILSLLLIGILVGSCTDNDFSNANSEEYVFSFVSSGEIMVFDDERNELTGINIGLDKDDVSRSFDIYNPSSKIVKWEISLNTDYVEICTHSQGLLKPGEIQPVVVKVNHSKRNSNDNMSVITIVSDCGNIQIPLFIESRVPCVALASVSVTGRSTATLNGKILDFGNPLFNECGFVYSTESVPTLDNTFERLIVDEISDSIFHYDIDNLVYGQVYYVRAFVKSDLTTIYSEDVVCVKPSPVVPMVGTSTVEYKSIVNRYITVQSRIIDSGDPSYSERGFVYDVEPNPTINNNSGKVIIEGSGVEEFSATITDLKEGSVYYVRSYAKNDVGCSYGEEIVVDFYAEKPQVRTDKIDFLFNQEKELLFTVSGTVMSKGDPVAYSERGFVYCSEPEPTMELEGAKVEIVEGRELGEYAVAIKFDRLMLDHNYKHLYYYVRAFVKTDNEIFYGEILCVDVYYYSLPMIEYKGQRYRVLVCSDGELNTWDGVVTQVYKFVKQYGYEDWELPDKELLNAMYEQKEQIEKFSFGLNRNYWSITEYDDNNVWCQSFADGKMFLSAKNRQCSYLIIRKE